MTECERITWARYDVLFKAGTLAAVVADAVWMLHDLHPATDFSSGFFAVGLVDWIVAGYISGKAQTNRSTFAFTAVALVALGASLIPSFTYEVFWPLFAGIFAYFALGRPILRFARSPQFDQLERPDDIYKVFANLRCWD
jgi:hypothetical protein